MMRILEHVLWIRDHDVINAPAQLGSRFKPRRLGAASFASLICYECSYVILISPRDAAAAPDKSDQRPTMHNTACISMPLADGIRRSVIVITR
jgi:hypothetical protein